VTLSELDMSPWLMRAFAAAWGLVWGSFLNVVVYRVPRELSVVHPPSHCPACNAPVRAWDNIPLVSYVLLGGKARCCGARLSPRYPLVELMGGLLSVAILETSVLALGPETSVVRASAVFLSEFALAMGLLAAAFIDLEHMYLPDPITIGGTVLGIATATLRGVPLGQSLLGAIGGFVGVWLPFVLGYALLRGRAGMGLGDAKLTMLAGAWFGWMGAAFALFAGALQASLAAMLVLAARGRIDEPEAVRADREELQRAAEAGDEEAKKLLEDDPLGKPPEEGVLAARLPFGPFLILAMLEWMLAGTWIRDRWLGFF
jgi:leader peptidase (prepilin peptidase)/N-methyltransferase